MKIGTPLTRALGNVYTNFDFSVFFFVFNLQAPAGRTDRTRNAACRVAA